MARKALTKKIRFEVFKRDSFTCQYCGQTAPNVILNVDHINPVANGGKNELLNLITSCFECNSGKKDRLLSDTATLSKQINAAKILSEKREQLKMMSDWAQSLKNLQEDELKIFEKYIGDNYDVYLSDYGKNEFRKTLKKYGLPDCLLAADKSANQYLNDSEIKEERVKFLDYIPKICYWQKRERENPVEAEIRKIAYTANKIWFRCNPQTLAIRMIELNNQTPLGPKDFMSFVSASTGIMQFEENVEKWMDGLDG